MAQPTRSAPAVSQSGFTLMEVAVVVFIIALILGSIMVPLSAQVDQRQSADAQRQLEEIREALIGFALAQNKPKLYLPCPDATTAIGGATPNDGREDRVGTACATLEGNVPWVTLGIPGADPWGNRIRYRVSTQYSDSADTAPITLASDGQLQVCSASTCVGSETITEPTVDRNKPAALLLIHGPNGWGAISAATNALVLPPGCAAAAGCADMSANEIENADGDLIFVSRPPSPSNSSGGQFDDIVIWLSPHVLKQRLVAGGRLP